MIIAFFPICWYQEKNLSFLHSSKKSGEKYGGQIEIAPPREQRPGSAEMAESPSDAPVSSESMAPPPHGEEGAGEFQFLPGEVAFAG
jgi:hypothetical protein